MYEPANPKAVWEPRKDIVSFWKENLASTLFLHCFHIDFLKLPITLANSHRNGLRWQLEAWTFLPGSFSGEG